MAETTTSSITCSRSGDRRRGVHEHAVQPAGLGDEGHDRALAVGQGAVDPPGRVRAAGEGDAVHAVVGGQRRADRLAASRDQGQESRVQAGGMVEAHGLRGDQRRLLGGLGQHRVAGREGGGDLAGEDGQGEVPRADADEDAAAAKLQLVGLAGGTLQDFRMAELLLREVGVVAAEVRGFPHLGHSVWQGLARLTRQDGDQAVAVLLQRIGHGAQHRRALGAARCVPRRLGVARGAEGQVDVLRRGFGGLADDPLAV
jgi:hypothetical protein